MNTGCCQTMGITVRKFYFYNLGCNAELPMSDRLKSCLNYVVLCFASQRTAIYRIRCKSH